jgi:hypothetical protein
MDLASSDRVALMAPSELAGPLPRTVTLNFDGDARYLLLIVLLFFFGGAIWLGWKGYDDVQQSQHRAVLRSDGREVVGEVTGFSFGRDRPTTVNYRFTVHGVTYSGSADEPRTPGPSTSLNKSDKILVRFLPSNPAINHPDAWEWSAFIGLEYIAFQVFFMAMGGLALAVLWRDRKLAREGKVAEGVVTSCTRKDRSFRVEYEFRTEDGVPVKGSSDSVDEYGASARIWILYLPQRPRRNHIYPLSFFDVAG